MLPAYVPNSAAAAVGGGFPLDGGRYWSDNRRIFGDGKTIRGFIGGVFCGICVGLIQIFAQITLNISFLPQMTLLAVFLLATGSLVGDIVKSFFKRRVGLIRGEKWPIIDQYDFVVGAFIFLILGNFSFAQHYLTLPVLIVIVIITPILHRLVNIIGYKIGVKEVPW